MTHTWTPHPRNPKWLQLAGSVDSLVRTVPDPRGRYLWQFRKVVSFADSVDAAKDYVEAGAEFFAAMRRNPYSP